MKDFDFDELDRAVSSALGGRETVRPVAPEVREADTSDVEATSVAVERGADDARSPRSSSRGRSSGGRVMDIVHPGAAQPAREVTPAVDESAVAPEPPVRKEVPMNDFRMVSRKEAAPIVAESVAPVVELPAEDEWEPPVESPFLPDAKVEKRPLGASEPTGELMAAVSSDDQTVTEVELPPVEEISPEEELVTDEVVLIEENPTIEDAPLASSLSDAEVEAESVPEFDTADAVEDAPAEYVGPVSITPQYTPKETPQQESGEIFDTEAYHQPFPAQQKKKSTAKIILVTLLILLVGGAAGAGVYFYVLPIL